jgi:hypothetical protein
MTRGSRSVECLASSEAGEALVAPSGRKSRSRSLPVDGTTCDATAEIRDSFFGTITTGALVPLAGDGNLNVVVTIA